MIFYFTHIQPLLYGKNYHHSAISTQKTIDDDDHALLLDQL